MATETDQHSEGQHDQHEGKSHGRAGDALGAQGMTDEDSVNQIVGSLGQHADDGRNGETKQQPRNAGLPELCRTIHFGADQGARPVPSGTAT